MAVNAYPGGESPFYGEPDEVTLTCDECGHQWDAVGELYPDEDGLTLQLAEPETDGWCPVCGSHDFDWELS